MKPLLCSARDSSLGVGSTHTHTHTHTRGRAREVNASILTRQTDVPVSTGIEREEEKERRGKKTDGEILINGNKRPDYTADVGWLPSDHYPCLLSPVSLSRSYIVQRLHNML